MFLSEGETDAVLAPVSGQTRFPSLIKDIDPIGDSLYDLALGVCKGGIQRIVTVEVGRRRHEFTKWAQFFGRGLTVTDMVDQAEQRPYVGDVPRYRKVLYCVDEGIARQDVC